MAQNRRVDLILNICSRYTLHVIGPYLYIFTLIISGLNALVKRQRFSDVLGGRIMLFENEQTHLKHKNREEFQVTTVNSSKEKADAATLLKYKVEP